MEIMSSDEESLMSLVEYPVRKKKPAGKKSKNKDVKKSGVDVRSLIYY